MAPDTAGGSSPLDRFSVELPHFSLRITAAGRRPIGKLLKKAQRFSA
jgi:hypothetical protein